MDRVGIKQLKEEKFNSQIKKIVIKYFIMNQLHACVNMISHLPVGRENAYKNLEP